MIQGMGLRDSVYSVRTRKIGSLTEVSKLPELYEGK
jgi:hypothetical protein